MPGPNSAVSTVDGTLNFRGGVDSLKVTTIQSAQNPDGLARNELAWLNNGTVRDGGISPRPAWKRLKKLSPATGLWQGGKFYKPLNGDPYLMGSISGHIIRADPDFGNVVDLSLTAFQPPAGTAPSFIWLQNVDGVAGTAIPAGTDPVVGSYSAFTMPPVGQIVRVTLTSPFTGAIGSTVGIGASATHIWSLHTFVAPLLITRPPNFYGPNVVPGTPATEIAGDFVHIGPVLVTTHSMSVTDPSSLYNPLLQVTYWDNGSIGTNHFIVVQASGSNPQLNPAFERHSYFEQAEQFMVIQSGDGVTLPLFWDGLFLRRSIGITNTAVAPGTPGINEIPAATAMHYLMGRLWYAQGRNYSAGDIVKGASGTLAYNFLDAVLNVTENPLVLGGDGFAVPTQAGTITALSSNANLDTTLGQGVLFVFTQSAVYSLNVPVTRTAWIAATNANQPLQTVALLDGTAGDRSIVSVNGDLYFQTKRGHILSLMAARRYFGQPANLPLSSQEQRIINFNDDELLEFGCGIEFDNRLLQTALPINSPQGVVHSALMPLDFAPISRFGEELTPTWEGHYEGPDILQMFTAQFGTKTRAFAVVVSRIDQGIELWELTESEKFDVDDKRIKWQIEFPAFTWGEEFAVKKLIAAELWVDRVFGEVVFTLEYRPDGDTCWHPWRKWKICSPRNSCETVDNPICYPITPFDPSYRHPMITPKPPPGCATASKRPLDQAYQFQPRLTIEGSCRLRGFLLHCEPRERDLHPTICANV